MQLWLEKAVDRWKQSFYIRLLVIKDVDNPPQAIQVTLSGLLNSIDGLQSSSRDEWLAVLTTNYKGPIDPVLLRPRQMNIRLHMYYCLFSGFKTLASNYLNIQEHYLFEIIEERKATPAEVTGELMKGADAEVALQGLKSFLQNQATPTEVTVELIWSANAEVALQGVSVSCKRRLHQQYSEKAERAIVQHECFRNSSVHNCLFVLVRGQLDWASLWNVSSYSHEFSESRNQTPGEIPDKNLLQRWSGTIMSFRLVLYKSWN